MIRLQKHIADLGICSRRKAEELIGLGKVKVNGEVVREMGVKVDSTKDKVEVDSPKLGALNQEESLIYIALNKPIDYITSTSDKQGRTILSLLDRKKISARVYPVGRLDKDSEGLVLLTNDGNLTNVLTHPRYEHEKEYEITIDKPLTRDVKKVLSRGMKIDDEMMQGIEVKKEFNKGKRVIVTVILKEGKNRQIRKMFGRLGYNLISLKRVRIGKLKLGTLPVGKWRSVGKDKII